MVLYHKDFSKEGLEPADLWRVSGIDDETAKNGSANLVTDKEKVALNRARVNALLLAEEMGAEINVEQNNDGLCITISKKI